MKLSALIRALTKMEEDVGDVYVENGEGELVTV